MPFRVKGVKSESFRNDKLRSTFDHGQNLYLGNLGLDVQSEIWILKGRYDHYRDLFEFQVHLRKFPIFKVYFKNQLNPSSNDMLEYKNGWLAEFVHT